MAVEAVEGREGGGRFQFCTNLFGRSDSILVYSLMFCMYISKISTVVVVTVSLTIN